MARRRVTGVVGVGVLLMLFAMAPMVWAAPSSDEADSIDADNQSLVNGTVTVTEVNASQDGWVAIHLDEGGKPGKVIGQTAVKKGETYGVGVKLSETVPVGGKMWAMLHIDAGTKGTYEFPGPDTPVIVNGGVVMKQISITATAQAPSGLPNTGGVEGAAAVLLGICGLALLSLGLWIRQCSRA